MIPMQPPFQMMSGAFPSPFMYPNSYMFSFSSPMAGWSQWPVGELFFLPIPTTVWVSNTVAVRDANTSTFIILSRWLIIPNSTTRCPTRRSRLPARGTTTAAESWTKKESSA
ncbi:hypothetical protein Gotur_029865 [Gossypium turneri]